LAYLISKKMQAYYILLSLSGMEMPFVNLRALRPYTT